MSGRARHIEDPTYIPWGRQDEIRAGALREVEAVMDALEIDEFLAERERQGRTLHGTFRRERLTCTTEHLPGGYNAALDRTWCICGEHTWDGPTPTVWMQAEIRRPLPGAVPMVGGVGLGAPGLSARDEVIGWDVYELPVHRCDDRCKREGENDDE